MIDDLLNSADAFRLGIDPTPDDVSEANWLIDRLSAQLKVRVDIERQREKELARAMDLCGFGSSTHY